MGTFTMSRKEVPRAGLVKAALAGKINHEPGGRPGVAPHRATVQAPQGPRPSAGPAWLGASPPRSAVAAAIACRPRGLPCARPDSALLLARVVNLAEERPALAVELGELLLLDGGEVGRARVDLDAGQQQRQLEVLDIGGLPHDVLPGEIVTALL